MSATFSVPEKWQPLSDERVALLTEYHASIMNGDGSESTADSYTRHVHRFLDWLDGYDIDYLDVRGIDLEDHLDAMLDDGYSDSSVRIRRASISRFYTRLNKWAESRTVSTDIDIDSADVPENPSDGVDPKYWQKLDNPTKKEQSLKGEIHYLRPEQIQQLVKSVPNPTIRNELLVKLLYQTGARAHELAQVRIEDIDRDLREIKIYSDKTSDSRIAYYHSNLDFLLSTYIDGGYRDSIPSVDESSYLFPTNKRPYIDPAYMNQVVRKTAKRAGLQTDMYEDKAGATRSSVTAHTLRHSMAVQSIKNGVDIRTLQLVLGHENLETTEKYLRMAEDDVREKMIARGAGTEMLSSDD